MKPDFDALAADWLRIELYDGQRARLAALLASVYADGVTETVERCAAEVEDERSRHIVRSASYEVVGWCLDRIRALLPGAKP